MYLVRQAVLSLTLGAGFVLKKVDQIIEQVSQVLGLLC